MIDRFAVPAVGSTCSQSENSDVLLPESVTVAVRTLPAGTSEVGNVASKLAWPPPGPGPDVNWPTGVAPSPAPDASQAGLA